LGGFRWTEPPCRRKSCGGSGNLPTVYLSLWVRSSWSGLVARVFFLFGWKWCKDSMRIYSCSSVSSGLFFLKKKRKLNFKSVFFLTFQGHWMNVPEIYYRDNYLKKNYIVGWCFYFKKYIFNIFDKIKILKI
jgi:hypothetical protein